MLRQLSWSPLQLLRLHQLQPQVAAAGVGEVETAGVVIVEEVVAVEAAAVEEVEVEEVGVGPALQEQDPITTLDCVPFAATMGIVHLGLAPVRSMEVLSRVHHQLELMGYRFSAKMIRIWDFAVSHVIMAIVPLQPAE